MKVIRVASIVTLLVVILSVCLVSAVSALEQNEIEVLTFKSDVVKVPGEIFGIRILINSTTNQELTISAVGIHLDWMDKDELYGLNYANSPVILEAGEKYNVDIINFTVPIGTSSGNHSYFVGIDGYEDDGTAFSWTSSENSENVISVAGSSSSNPPTSTATPSGQPGQNMDLTLIIFGVVLVVVIVIGILIVVMRKKRAPTSVESNADQTAPMKPDEGQDFNI